MIPSSPLQRREQLAKEFRELPQHTVTGKDNTLLVSCYQTRAETAGTLEFLGGADRNLVRGQVGAGVTVGWGYHNVVNGRYPLPPTIDMGGTSGSISPTDMGIGSYKLNVDAGGVAVNLQGIDNIAKEDVSVILAHRGGETITIEHNAAVSNPIYTSDGVNFDLTANGQQVGLSYDAITGVWRELWRNTT